MQSCPGQYLHYSLSSNIKTLHYQTFNSRFFVTITKPEYHKNTHGLNIRARQVWFNVTTTFPFRLFSLALCEMIITHCLFAVTETLLASFLFSSSAMASLSCLWKFHGGIRTVSTISTNTNMLRVCEQVLTRDHSLIHTHKLLR